MIIEFNSVRSMLKFSRKISKDGYNIRVGLTDSQMIIKARKENISLILILNA